jgi:hypothetical protein
MAQDIFGDINRIFDQATPKIPRIRVMPEGSCPYCDQFHYDDMMPYHHASSGCKSGMRNHCTCDVCF